jgi:hypothetical protein
MDMIDPEAGKWSGRDPLRRVVQVTLAIYLMPVVAVVCAIGGASIVLSHAANLASRLVTGGLKPAWPGPHARRGLINTPGRRAMRRVRIRVRG